MDQPTATSSPSASGSSTRTCDQLLNNPNGRTPNISGNGVAFTNSFEPNSAQQGLPLDQGTFVRKLSMFFTKELIPLFFREDYGAIMDSFIKFIFNCFDLNKFIYSAYNQAFDNNLHNTASPSYGTVNTDDTNETNLYNNNNGPNNPLFASHISAGSRHLQ